MKTFCSYGMMAVAKKKKMRTRQPGISEKRQGFADLKWSKPDYE